MTPLVSVVIPTYNRAADLRRALESVRRQTVRDWEVVVVDNHSTDDTREVVASFDDARIRMLDVHNGGVVAVSRNLGIRDARAPCVAMLDSDDWWTPRKLESSLDVLNRGADVVYHDLYLVRREGQALHLRRSATRAVRTPVHDDLIRYGNALTNSSVVVRKRLLLEIGGISEEQSLIAFEDYDTWLRISRTTEKFVRIPRTLGYYWAGGANLTTPERTLRNLDSFRVSHLESDVNWRGRAMPGWLHYAYGRAYYHLGSHQLAVKHLRHALFGELIASKRAKAALTLIELAGRRVARRRISP